jgi:hypothetical protein
MHNWMFIVEFTRIENIDVPTGNIPNTDDRVLMHLVGDVLGIKWITTN